MATCLRHGAEGPKGHAHAATLSQKPSTCIVWFVSSEYLGNSTGLGHGVPTVARREVHGSDGRPLRSVVSKARCKVGVDAPLAASEPFTVMNALLHTCLIASLGFHLRRSSDLVSRSARRPGHGETCRKISTHQTCQVPMLFVTVVVTHQAPQSVPIFERPVPMAASDGGDCC